MYPMSPWPGAFEGLAWLGLLWNNYDMLAEAFEITLTFSVFTRFSTSRVACFTPSGLQLNRGRRFTIPKCKMPVPSP